MALVYRIACDDDGVPRFSFYFNIHRLTCCDLFLYYTHAQRQVHRFYVRVSGCRTKVMRNGNNKNYTKSNSNTISLWLTHSILCVFGRRISNAIRNTNKCNTKHHLLCESSAWYRHCELFALHKSPLAINRPHGEVAEEMSISFDVRPNEFETGTSSIYYYINNNQQPHYSLSIHCHLELHNSSF